MKTQLTKALILVSIAAGFAAAGCELIVDFDRTKIPVEAVDSGIVTDAATNDGSVTDAGDACTEICDSGAGDADAEAPDAEAPDAADASDQ